MLTLPQIFVPRWLLVRAWETNVPRSSPLLVTHFSSTLDHKMPRGSKIIWGTDPDVKFGKTDPIDAKGRLTALFESGKIDVNNWTTKLLHFSFPNLQLNRFPESTIRTHCSKVCNVVIHQRGLDQQARLLGRRSNNNVDDDESSNASSMSSSGMQQTKQLGRR